ncbi:unnamed protein product [Sphenostylis stenocarpa]|uniref:Pseudouridine-5'-phosphate glycosidase n=1 Tax=Sphenostylis stenocarpa TaxID=92480 RepID=A0AA86W455_9FABA|nr:unnamed protein product [Sphenostylis stenocarpa]
MTFSAASRLANLRRHLDFTETVNKAEHSIKVKVAAEVSEALSLGRAVVALESTIISHGMPYPQNLETAKEVERIVRENGAVPATIAILDGTPCVGLSLDELERLATLGTSAQKTARRDIANVVSVLALYIIFIIYVYQYVVAEGLGTEEPIEAVKAVARGGNGATTVSATMFFASMVDIPIFVTGGIGGVHRHWEHTMDISSDLTELGKTPVAVVCAGVKSILDIPRTLEYLETLGVCVAAYKTSEFPAFFTESSGCKVSCRVDSPEDCACLIEASFKLKLGTGILIAVPIPQEHSTSGRIIESAIQKAIKEARENNITGSAETPFLLARVNDLTGGASLAANVALVKNNALVGAKVAVALAQIRENGQR